MLFSLSVFLIYLYFYNILNSQFILSFVPVNMTKNTDFARILLSFFDYFTLYEDNVVLLSGQVVWAMSLDNYTLYINFLKNLFTLNEIELLFKTFKELETLNNFSNIETNLSNIFSPLNYKWDFTGNLVDSILMDIGIKLYCTEKEKIIPTTTFLLNMWVFIEAQIALVEATELILWKKILTFFIDNSFFIILLSLSVLVLNKSTNLIYTLISFLSFAILSGLFIIFWGSEYIGLCVLLIYGAAIPVLALYIIMLVNVDLIQWLFFIESVKNFTFKMQLKYLLISFFFASCIFFFNETTVYFDLTSKIYFLNQLVKHFYFILLIRWYLSLIDTSYGIVSPSDIPLNFYNTDIDKVASAAFKLSFNELFALVMLLLIAIIVVISISWPTDPITGIISYELDEINQPFYQLLLNQSVEMENIVFRYGVLLTTKAKLWEPFVGEEPFNFRFYRSLHLHFWGIDMGDQPYKNLMYLLIPRWREKK